MEKTDAGTSVGVDDPYGYVDRCDYLTDDGRCRFAREQGDRDPTFADERSRNDFRCPVAGGTDVEGLTGPWEWSDCPHFRCRTHDRACVRCGLDEVRLAHDDERPLLEEHHLSYRAGSSAGDGTPSHEITVYLCRWCHAKVHDSWARIDDDAAPDPEAIAEREGRRSKEQQEFGFESAAERFDVDDE
ncbi:DUF7097 family protein [Salinibaculum rarum]|uniref:DUF7097 family protein n=1 Tax=Salinibaculum rarum TaxID=3058903 RepID=UPI00265D72CF|nr:hypothetical protein [Salinibaculum sp. KK48]